MLLTILKGLKKIKRTSERTKKEKILKYFLKGEYKSVTKELLINTYNPFYQYNVRVADEYRDPEINEYQHTKDRWDGHWDNFCTILSLLRKRQVTGKAARVLVNKTLERIPPVYAFWFMKILHKDLKIGLGARTIEKLVPGLIPTFRIQKGNVYEGDTNTLPERFVIEPKYDGLRGIVVINDKGEARAYSSKGKPLWNIDHILSEIEEAGLRNWVFDGEFYGPDWNKTISVLQTESAHKNPGKVKYYVFDVLSLDEWTARKCDTLYGSRLFRRGGLLASVQGEYVKATPMTEASSATMVNKMYRHYLKKGFEGVMIKDLNGKYVFKRSKDWMKYKPEFTCDLKVIGVQEGGGKLEGMLGALKCRGTAEYGGKTYKVKTKVGTGFSEKKRKELWQMHNEDLLVGCIVEVKFQEIARSKSDPTKFALRFPVFVRMRLDKE